MKIVQKPIAELSLDPQNARKHSQRNLDAIKVSLEKFGQRKPIVVHRGLVLAGNGTVEAAKSLGWSEITIAEAPEEWDLDTAKAYALADNKTAELAEWDESVLAKQLLELQEKDWDISQLGFDVPDVAETQELNEDEIPEPPVEPVTKLGDIYQLGRHRLMCGDSTDPSTIAKLMNKNKAVLLHADPPYGMGKEKDGVLNDNLYSSKLDEFQMAWWKAFRPHLENNASAYIWGNAEDLWRLWYKGSLKDYERLTFRNEILWHQGGVSWGKDGMSNLRSYATMGERCLFFFLGEQGYNNNSDNYWDGWEPVRSYLKNEMIKCGWTTKDLNSITGTQMASHWVTKSQWGLITETHYKTIQNAAKNNAFKKDYDALKKDYDALKKDFYSTRAYFDSGHDKMSDVWEAQRVMGEERNGHATPKPIELMERVMKSSAPENGLTVEPFGGSGSTLIAAEQTNRICYTMELTPEYCDVIIKRWENLTGLKAELVNSK